MRTCFHSYVGPQIGVCLLASLTTFAFCLSLAHFLVALHTLLGLSHPIATHLSQCQCGHTIYDLGTHLLRCPCKNERITNHNALWNIIVTIVLESETHVQREVSHIFLCHTQWRMDILITRDNFQTFMDVITNLIHRNIMWWTSTETTHVTMMTIQEKTWSYIERTLGDDLFPLLLKPMGVFILVLIHFLLLVHRSLSCIICGLL
jgi:hypothetical protein